MARQDKRGPDDLDIPRAEGFLRRERAAQRVGLVLLTVFVIAGAVGLFGNGLLSRAVVNSGPAHITYERFSRQTVLSDMTISVNGLAADKVEIRLSRELLDNMMELEVRPASMEHRFEERAIVFEVPVAAGTARLELHYKPRDNGLFRTDVGVNGVVAARLWQLVYF